MAELFPFLAFAVIWRPPTTENTQRRSRGRQSRLKRNSFLQEISVLRESRHFAKQLAHGSGPPRVHLDRHGPGGQSSGRLRAQGQLGRLSFIFTLASGLDCRIFLFVGYLLLGLICYCSSTWSCAHLIWFGEAGFRTVMNMKIYKRYISGSLKNGSLSDWPDRRRQSEFRRSFFRIPFFCAPLRSP